MSSHACREEGHPPTGSSLARGLVDRVLPGVAGDLGGREAGGERETGKPEVEREVAGDGARVHVCAWRGWWGQRAGGRRGAGNERLSPIPEAAQPRGYN